MKKMVILFLLIFVLFGCTEKNPNIPKETEDIPILYETHMILKQYKTVEIFDTIFLTSLKELDNFVFKAAIFDAELAKSLTQGSVSIRSSESGYSTSPSKEDHTLTYHQFMSYVATRTYVMQYLVLDFSNYFTDSFHEDMQKLENNEITADQMFSKYGTHVVMAVDNGFKADLNLTIESDELQSSEFEYIVDVLMNTRPITLPIQDETYLSYEVRSRILFTVQSTLQNENLQDVLNNLGASMPYVNMLNLEGIVPIYRLFGFNEKQYPTAIEKLETRYTELFPSTY